MKVYAVFFDGVSQSVCYGIYSTGKLALEKMNEIRFQSSYVKNVWVESFVLDD